MVLSTDQAKVRTGEGFLFESMFESLNSCCEVFPFL